MSEQLRLAALLGGLSIVSDLGYGLPVDTALRSCLIGTAPARGDVADGSAVLEAAQRLQPDVIVVDLNLPHVHGLEACRQAQASETGSDSHRVLGDERSGRQATIRRGRSIGLCV